MKTKGLIFTFIIGLGASAFWYLSTQESDGPVHYKPFSPTEKTFFKEGGYEEEEKGESARGGARYLSLLRANPYTGLVSAAAVKKAVDQANNSPKRKKPANISWVTKGPDNIGGRTRAIVVDNQNNKVLYAGGVSGGLFRSTNKGSSWHPVKYEGADQYKSLAIVCMEQASDGTIYFGTGEQGFSYPSAYKQGIGGKTGHIGMGMWKSENGTDWTHLESTIPNNPMSGNNGWDNVHEIAIDPNNPERLLVGTDAGLKVSEDGGQTWQTVTNGISVGTILEVVFSPDGQTVFASNGSALYRSTDGGNSFNRLTSNENNFPSGGNGRIEVAIAPSDPDFVYANVVGGRFNDVMRGIYQSQDNGETWQPIAEGGGSFAPFSRGGATPQGIWNNVIAVDPAKKNRIFVGGIEFWLWDGGSNYDGIGQWKKASNPSPYYGANDQFKDPGYLHVDNHEITFDMKSNPAIMYIGNDGGISKTKNGFHSGTPQYRQINMGYTTTQFYAFDVSQRGDIAGGTQDQGSLKRSLSSLSGKSYKVTEVSGDGFYASISNLRPDVYIMESQNANIQRSLDAGNSFSGELYDNNIGNVESKSLFNNPFTLYEKRHDTLSRDSVIYSADTSVVLRAGQEITASGNNVSYYQSDSNFTALGGNSFRADIDISVLPGDTVEVRSQNGVVFEKQLKKSLGPSQTIKLQDPVRALFVLPLRNEVWLTPDMLNFGTNPTWFKIADINLQTPITVEVGPDGQHVFVGGWTGSQGRVYRISGIRSAHYQYKSKNEHVDSFREREGITVEKIADFNNVVSSVNTDPKDANRILVTNGNYGTNDHVRYSSNALDSAQNVTFTVLDNQGPQNAHLPSMPVYDGIFRLDSSNQVIVGTEMGVWFYDMSNPGQGWSEINQGMDRVPTHMLRQIRENRWAKGPAVYAATHGRGIFMTSSFNPNTGIDDWKANKEDGSEPTLELYPNPARTYTNVDFDIPEGSNGNLQLISLSGQVVRNQIVRGKAGKQNIRLSTGRLKTGTYIMRVSGSGFNKTAKLSIAR